jgi:predicted PurR-regulated permease PerM
MKPELSVTNETARQPKLQYSFTPGQLRFLRFVVLSTATAVFAGVVLLALWGLGLLISMFQALLLPVAIAGVLALVLFPISEFIHLRLRLPRAVSATLTVVALIAALGAFAVMIVPLVVKQLVQLAEQLPVVLERAYAIAYQSFPTAAQYLHDRVTGVQWEGMFITQDGALLETAGAYLALMAGVAFIPLFLFFFLLIGQRLERVTLEVTALLNRRTQDEVRYLVDVFLEYIAAFFRGQLLIALIMGALMATGFTLIGLDSAILLGITLGLLNIVPFLGTAIGLLTALPYAFLQPGGGMTLMLLTFGVFVVVQLIESWLLTPKIMSDRSGLHPMMVVISLFFWGTVLGGVIGVLLAVPLSAFVATLWHQTRYRYASRVVPSMEPEYPEFERAPERTAAEKGTEAV